MVRGNDDYSRAAFTRLPRRPHARDLDVTLPGEPPDQEIGEAERDAKIARERPLLNAFARGNGLEDLPIVGIVRRGQMTLRASRLQSGYGQEGRASNQATVGDCSKNEQRI